ncbi:Uncharacterised protein [uncultured Leptotrichia sp.]|uniref:hypothetical protein n=1 Tax=uncultured Leptotrichia sp. TaxID=159271 RepID=UPI001A463676|nr:hypothetical protein [uncultured Leptotrichia sp.]VTX50285.1 Uncharacterised protein [uncultured Leptotrichia sp.]
MINNFMYLYMYHLEKFLLSKKEEILKLSFQSDEANTDRPLKEYLKNLIENNFNKIPKKSNINFLNIESHQSTVLSEFNSFKILRVLLPEEIKNNNEIKKAIVNNKTSIYTNPDICFEISDGNKIFYETIELKSTKKDNIPGSSIQQILPNEWVIFIKHTSSSIDIVTGKYINSINTTIQFPDRSPRPQVSFKELKNWNNSFRLICDNILTYSEDKNSINKLNLIQDWQKVLSDRWIDMLFESNTIKANEPWFNNTMRKFILEFLEKYETLNKNEKLNFKRKIKNLTQNI